MGEEFFVGVVISRKSMWIPYRGGRFSRKRRHAAVLPFVAEKESFIE